MTKKKTVSTVEEIKIVNTAYVRVKAACDRMEKRWKGKLFQSIKKLFLNLV